MTHSQQTATAKKSLIQRRDAISHSRAGNDADAASLGAEKRPEERAENGEISDVLVLLSEKETAELKDVDAALKRLELGTWGRCDKCGGIIASARLTALPEARTCMSCAS